MASLAPDTSLASIERLQPPMGVNASSQALMAACPGRRYKPCFYNALLAKYPVTRFELPPMPKQCAVMDGARALADPACVLPPAERTLHYTSGPELPLCSPTSLSASLSTTRLRCNSPAAAINARAVLLLGVPSSPTAKGTERRKAIRAAWLLDEHVGRTVVVCFLLSARTPAEALEPMQREHAEHGDMLFLDSPETPWLITQPTKYSGFKMRGRGMPTFKQYASSSTRSKCAQQACKRSPRHTASPHRYAFFQHAAAHHAPVPYVGKIDDDTAPNLRVLVPFLQRLGCLGPSPLALVGAINWAAIVPRALEFGVRGDRCGFGWDLSAALNNFGSSFGTPGTPGYVESCDTRGAVLPFPYGTGAGYFFSAALLQHVATSAEVTQWVADAAGPEHETLQWQKLRIRAPGTWCRERLARCTISTSGPSCMTLHAIRRGSASGGAAPRTGRLRTARCSCITSRGRRPFCLRGSICSPRRCHTSTSGASSRSIAMERPRGAPPARGASGVSNARWPRRPKEAAAAAAAGGGGGERSGRRRQGYRRATDDRIRVRPRCLHLRALCPRDARHDAACFAMPRAPPPPRPLRRARDALH